MVTTNTGQPGSTQSHSEIKDDLKKSGEQLSQSMKGSQEQASKEAKNQAENVTHRAAEEMEDISRAAEAAADALSDEHHEQLSSYVSDIAGYVGSMATSLRHKSADDLVSDARRMAHHNPTLFIAGGLALGLGIARVAKSASSSQKNVTHQSGHAPSSEQHGSYGSSYSSGTTPSSGTTSATGSTAGAAGSSVGSSFSSTGGAGTGASQSTAQPGSLNSSFTNKSSQHENI